jgi:hypothetical protein
MDVSKMTRQEIEALMRLLAECERRELALLLLERREAERQGRVHYPTPPGCVLGSSLYGADFGL